MEADQLDAAIEMTIVQLLANGPALIEIKRLFGQFAMTEVDQAVRELTAQTIARARSTPEARKGFTAFLAKRPTVLFVTHSLREAFSPGDRIQFLSAQPSSVILDHAVDLQRPCAIEDSAVQKLHASLLDRYPQLLAGQIARSREKTRHRAPLENILQHVFLTCQLKHAGSWHIQAILP